MADDDRDVPADAPAMPSFAPDGTVRVPARSWASPTA